MPSTEDTWESLPSLLFHFSRSYLHLCAHFSFTVWVIIPILWEFLGWDQTDEARGIGLPFLQKPRLARLHCVVLVSFYFFFCGILTGEDSLMYNAEMRKYKGSLYSTVASFSLQTFHYAKVFMWSDLLFCKKKNKKLDIMVLSGVRNIKQCDARKAFVRFPNVINLFDLRSGTWILFHSEKQKKYWVWQLKTSIRWNLCLVQFLYLHCYFCLVYSSQHLDNLHFFLFICFSSVCLMV